MMIYQLIPESTYNALLALKATLPTLDMIMGKHNGLFEKQHITRVYKFSPFRCVDKKVRQFD
jgi:hypothetical protein